MHGLERASGKRCKPCRRSKLASTRSAPIFRTCSTTPSYGEDDNVVVRDSGPPPEPAFAIKPHCELGEALGIIDFERATKLSGSRVSILRGAGARLSRGIASFFLSRALERGYVEIAPPYLVTRDTMWSTGQLSKFADAMFRDVVGDLFMIPAAELPLPRFTATRF